MYNTMRELVRKRSMLSSFVVFGVCCVGQKSISAFAPPLQYQKVISSSRTQDENKHLSRYRKYNRNEALYNMVAGTKRPRSTVDDILDEDNNEIIDDQPTSKPKIKFSALPDFMQKDPLAMTKQRWIEETTIPVDIEAKDELTKRKKNEMMIMSAASFTLAVGVIYALASSSPEMVTPQEINESINESENVVKDLLKEGGAEKLEFATRNIVGQVLPNSAEDIIAISIGEGIAGVIGAFATWLLGLGLNFSEEGMGETMEELYSEAVADGDYFLTRAAAQPLLEGIGVPLFFASLLSVLIATVPYEVVKVQSQKQKNDMEEQRLLNLLLEEEANRKQNMSVIDEVSNNVFDFINRLNVRQTNFDEVFEEIEEEPDINELQKERLKSAQESLDYVELFADLTKWLEYDVLISNYRGVLALPNGQLLSSGWESAIFGLLAALSSQLYTDVLYLYSDFGSPAKREKTLNRSLEGWTSIYATKCLSAATLFGTYEAVRGPTSRAFRQLLSGGTGGCAGSEDYDLCLETYLVDNPPSATFEADFRATSVSIMNWMDTISDFSWLLPLNDQETLNSYFRGAAVSAYSELVRLFNM